MSAQRSTRWQHILMRSWTHRGWLATLLWPLSALLGLLIRLRQGLFMSGVLKTHRLPVPVIVVGNVVAGGSGKTPVVMAIARHLMSMGIEVGVVSRGYGRQASHCLEVWPTSALADVGDEPALIKRNVGCPVFVASKRLEAAKALLKTYPQTKVIISDDGLQHLALARDIDICVFDNRGIGNGWLLPAGPLREAWPKPVDLVLHTGSHPAMDGFRAQRSLATLAYRADGSSLKLTELGHPVNTGQPVKPILALAAIAQPGVFFSMLKDQGVVLAQTQALPDHYDFESWKPPIDKDYAIVCTEKDAVKLWPRYPQVWAVALTCTLEPAFLSALNRLLAQTENSPLSSDHGHTTT